MPPTPTRAGSTSGASATSQGSTAVRPPANAPHSMAAILGNITGLFTTARQGKLPAKSMTYLRSTIHEHYRYLVYSAVEAGRPNPLLDIPHALNPSLGPAALVDPATWLSMITTAEVEAKQKQAEGTLVVPRLPPYTGSGTGTSTPGSSPGASGSVRPPPPAAAAAAARQQQQLRAAGSVAATQAGSLAPSPAPSTTSQVSSVRHVLPATLMKGDELRKWANMPAVERANIMNNDLELKRRFEASVQWYRAQSKAKGLAQENAAAQAQASSAAGGSQVKPELASAQQSSVGQSAPTNAANINGAANPSNPPNPTTAFNNPNAILGNPNFTLSQPPARNNPPLAPTSSANLGPSNIVGLTPGQNNFDPSTSTYNPSTAPQQAPPPIPPPAPRRAPEEPEGERRKRKYRDWVREMGTGLELELGLEEILNDVVEKFVNDLARSGARLAKHRKGEKVEVKDLAFYLDKQYHMTVPGFDAVLPQRTHIPADDEDKRRLRAVIPRNVLVRAEDGVPATGTNAPARENGDGGGA